MFAQVVSGATIGVEAYLVDVETNVAPGLPRVNIGTLRRQWSRR